MSSTTTSTEKRIVAMLAAEDAASANAACRPLFRHIRSALRPATERY